LVRKRCGADDALDDEPVDRFEPAIADRVALEKRFVFRGRKLDQGAVG
jgi:hypothetical protein